MNKHKIMTVLLLIILTAILVVPVHAAEVSNIKYASEVYTETDNYVLDKVQEPPGYVTSANTVGGTDILDQTVPPLHLERFAVLSKPGSGIDISFVLTSPGVKYQSDLQGLKVSVNTVPVTTDTITADKQVVRVQGNVPYDAVPNQAVRIIELSGMSAADNNKFLVHVTSDEMAAAKNAIYLLNEKITKGRADSLKPDLQTAVDNYKKGNFVLAKTFAEKGAQQGSSQTEGFNDGLKLGLIFAVISLVVGSIIGFWYAKKSANIPDLLKIEQVVVKYYGTRSENPFGPAKISKECEGILEKAFGFNAQRAEMLNPKIQKSQKDQYSGSVDPDHLDRPKVRPSMFRKLHEKILKPQKDQRGGSVDPDSITISEHPPSLFQALYEKTQYGRCTAFDEGIVFLNKCLRENESKR